MNCLSSRGKSNQGATYMSIWDHYLFRYVAVVIVSAAIAGVLGCKDDAGSTPSPPSPIPQVEVVSVMARTVPDEPEFIGQAEASRPVEIRSQVTGILKAVLFIEGREIKKGEKLYQIDPVPFEGVYQSAKARIAEAEARLVQARQDLARVKPLLEAQAVSQKDVDDAIAEDLAAKAALQRAKADLIKAKFDFDNTVITAPIKGLIERSRYYEGRLVSAQTDLLTVINRIDPMYVMVNVPESFLLKRRQDAIAVSLQHPGLAQLQGTIIFADGSTYNHEGFLDFTDVGLRTETGTRRARFVVANPDGVLLPGQFVRVRFKGTMKDHALLVPQRAVHQGPQGQIVFVVGEEDKVEMRPIKASRWQDKEWIIESGVRSGERVIVSGFHMVKPGAPVKPVPAAEPAAESTANGKPGNKMSNGGADHEAEAKPEATKDPQ
jgi:membrane fusion protein (multidrug efflux system)